LLFERMTDDIGHIPNHEVGRSRSQENANEAMHKCSTPRDMLKRESKEESYAKRGK
jgi:hypothetical protein